ncbi:alkylmercury lyase [Salinadaptatus halalkaliphilus]|uniref:Alkylmercury lyase n=1 Tax=Salinadaptatus halalkaliphilus TaxID=2419781 RepID=A0A4S3TH60_9EURY|nr:organomercurial lyase [Salinadaptatus halalkaliphilus]THE63236.1 alkylmercury lyase [Salinadaptatus halalkaliphilus]
MTADLCPCCGTVTEQDAATGSSTEQWHIDGAVLTTELPEELGSTLGRFLGTEPVDTLGGWVAAVRYHIDGPSLTIEELCVTDDETEHWGIVDGEKYHFACFYDAVILAALVDSPVAIRTKSPDGAVIEARAGGTDALTVTPDDAVFSFGIDKNVSPPSEDGPNLEDGYAAICPYVKAFPNRDAYEQWATSVHAATVAMPHKGTADLAAALVD